MEEIKQLIRDIEGELSEIDDEVEIADNKGVFVYARSRNIRKGALEITKLAKELRKVTQEHFTAQSD